MLRLWPFLRFCRRIGSRRRVKPGRHSLSLRSCLTIAEYRRVMMMKSVPRFWAMMRFFLRIVICHPLKQRIRFCRNRCRLKIGNCPRVKRCRTKSVWRSCRRILFVLLFSSSYLLFWLLLFREFFFKLAYDLIGFAAIKFLYKVVQFLFFPVVAFAR